MTVNKRTKLMRRGACFKCKEVGHLSRDCKKGPPKSIPQKKQGYKEAHTQIKAIINTLYKEDQAKFFWRSTGGGFLIQRPRSMLVFLTDILTVFNGSINNFFFTIPIKISKKNIEMETSIDSGAGGNFIDQNYARTCYNFKGLHNKPDSHFQKICPLAELRYRLKVWLSLGWKN